MERKRIYCGLTRRDCPNEKCQYIGTGFGCLNLGITSKEIKRESKENLLLRARVKVYGLSLAQSELRKKLSGLDGECAEAKEIRGNMMRNRLGKNGLRALNNLLRGTSPKKKGV